ALDKLLSSQVQLAQLGMDDVLVNVQGFFSLLMDWARVAEVQNPERYFVDPRSDESKRAFDARRKAAELERQRKDALVGQAVELEKMRTALEKYMHDTTSAIDVWKQKVEAAIE